MSKNRPAAIVVGVDGSESSGRAALWAAGVCDRLTMPLLLLHSIATPDRYLNNAVVSATKTATSADLLAMAHMILASAEDQVHKEFPRVRVETEARCESPRAALLDRSREAALVVVAGEKMSAAAGLLVGSTSLAVATRASCPVVVWREYTTPATAPVVVGVDDTLAGANALGAAFAHADHAGAPLHAVRAWTLTPPANPAMLPYVVDWEVLEKTQRAILDAAVDDWIDRYPEVKVERFLDDAHPARAILQRSVGAQLAVVGSRSTNTLAATLLGSTALNVLHHSRVPVMICHAEDKS